MFLKVYYPSDKPSPRDFVYINQTYIFSLHISLLLFAQERLLSAAMIAASSNLVSQQLEYGGKIFITNFFLVDCFLVFQFYSHSSFILDPHMGAPTQLNFTLNFTVVIPREIFAVSD